MITIQYGPPIINPPKIDNLLNLIKILSMDVIFNILNDMLKFLIFNKISNFFCLESSKHLSLKII
jgi:hypothetical protein